MITAAVIPGPPIELQLPCRLRAAPPPPTHRRAARSRSAAVTAANAGPPPDRGPGPTALTQATSALSPGNWTSQEEADPARRLELPLRPSTRSRRPAVRVGVGESAATRRARLSGAPDGPTSRPRGERFRSAARADRLGHPGWGTRLSHAGRQGRGRHPARGQSFDAQRAQRRFQSLAVIRLADEPDEAIAVEAHPDALRRIAAGHHDRKLGGHEREARLRERRLCDRATRHR